MSEPLLRNISDTARWVASQVGKGQA